MIEDDGRRRTKMIKVIIGEDGGWIYWMTVEDDKNAKRCSGFVFCSAADPLDVSLQLTLGLSSQSTSFKVCVFIFEKAFEGLFKGLTHICFPSNQQDGLEPLLYISSCFTIVLLTSPWYCWSTLRVLQLTPIFSGGLLVVYAVLWKLWEVGVSTNVQGTSD